jgi:hypothetical protein
MLDRVNWYDESKYKLNDSGFFFPETSMLKKMRVSRMDRPAYVKKCSSRSLLGTISNTVQYRIKVAVQIQPNDTAVIFQVTVTVNPPIIVC